VSVLIPALRPTWLREAVESALAQDFSPIEIVVCDDSGGDEVARLLAPYSTGARARVLTNAPPVGLVGNYRRLLHEARGRWGKFLDDDDVLLPGALSALVGAAGAVPGVTLAHGSCAFLAQDGAPLPASPRGVPALEDGRDFFLAFTRRPPLSPSVLFDVEAARNCGAFDHPRNIKSADWDAWLRVALGGAVAFVPVPVVRYRRHADSFSAQRDLALDVDNAAFVDAAARFARSSGRLTPRTVARWRRSTLAWYIAEVLSVHLPPDSWAALRHALGAFFRMSPPALLRALLRPRTAGALLASPLPGAHRWLQRRWRARYQDRSEPPGR